MNLRNRQWHETVVYVILWAILFAIPVAVIQFHHKNDSGGYPWHELFELWSQFAVFLVVFLLHNYLLAPLIVFKRRPKAYILCITLLLACFVTVQCMHRPDHGGPGHKEGGRMEGRHRPLPPEERMTGEEGMARFEGNGFRQPPKDMRGQRPDGPHGPAIVGQHDIIAAIILILMLGMNLGVKFYFRQRDNEQRMATLERQNLQQQLEFLRYQINPHFLMNTLNNIHALVDIDPEEAKQTIVGFSKILRFVLYDGSKQLVSLDRELAFLSNYIELMGMRLSEQVDLVIDLPTTTPDAHVPPLLFITYVENAFKHGVSYQQHSFIDIHISIEGNTLRFVCKNSRVPAANASNTGGVGLKNARRRLNLIYGEDYRLDINEGEDAYCVTLRIPLNPETDQLTNPQQ